MKKKFLLIYVIAFAITMQSCSSDSYNEEPLSDVVEIIGTQDYVAGLNSVLKDGLTKSVNDQEDTIVPELLLLSKEYLNNNNIDYCEFFGDSEDDRIIVFALALAEYNKIVYYNSITRTTVGGCVLQAMGLRALVQGKGITRAAIISLGKAIAKKAVPYLGWGLFAIDMAMCIAE